MTNLNQRDSQSEKGGCQRNSIYFKKSTSFTAPQKKIPDLSKAMEMMDSQTLLLTQLIINMEDGLDQFEEITENNLLICSRKRRSYRKRLMS
jgi:hypothetical protein